MTTLSRLCSLALLSTVLGCSAAPPLIDYTVAEDIEWNSLRTYSWEPRPGDRDPGPVIREVIERRMSDQGYVLVDEEGDFRVAVHGSLRGTQYTSAKLWDWDGPHDAQSGKLHMSALEGRSSRPLWSATSKQIWRADMELNELQAMLRKTLNEFMDHFPPN